MRTLASRLPVFFLFFLFLFVLPVATRADEIVITSGYLTVPRIGSGPTFSFGNAAQGFAVSNVGYTNGDGGNLAGLCFPCLSGQTLSINAQFSGSETLGNGPATVGGVNYERVFYGPASLFFNAPPIIFPLDNSPIVTITVPFTMTGFIGAQLDPDRLPILFTTTISGQGIATLRYSSYLTSSGWFHDPLGITYNFSPAAAPAAVPEPTTLVLFGTGLTAVVARYRRRRRTD